MSRPTPLETFADLERALSARVDYERRPPPGGFTLERVRAAALRLDLPAAHPTVHVAGTCGKGSVSALVAASADAAGLSVGLTTSPHLVDLRERIRLGSGPASDAAWVEAAQSARAAEDPGDPLTYFEWVILSALLAFRSAGVDLAVVEVGLGGRLDATQMVAPSVSVITRIALDHTGLLGTDHAAIAAEKAGILRPGVPLVAGPQQPRAREVIAARCAELGVEAWWLGEELRTEAHDEGWRVITPTGAVVVPARPDLRHPARPAHLALAAGVLSREQIPLEALAAAAPRLRWRGRFEVLPGAPPRVLDGAHDAPSVAALVEAFRSRFPGKQAVLVAAIARGKDVSGVVEGLSGVVTRAMCTHAHGPARSLPASELSAIFAAAGVEAETCEDVGDALARGLQLAAELDSPLLVSGSLHLVGRALAEWKEITLHAWGGEPL